MKCVALFVVLSCSFSLQASDEPAAKPQEKGTPGYVFCSDAQPNRLRPVFLNPCERVPAGRLACGHAVTVLRKHGRWLEIDWPDGRPRYVFAGAISQKAEERVPFDSDSAIADLGPPGCTAAAADDSETQPRLIYRAEPEYTDAARRKKINGTVLLSFTVGTDGLAHDITVDKKLGYGLDERAIETLKTWKFEPATRDGQPVEKHISVEMTFKVY
jgi:TonB family protein